MSENNQAGGPIGAAQTVSQAIDAWSAATAEALKQPDGQGGLAMYVPVVQVYLEVQLVQMKLEALFEELDHEHLLEAPRVMQRLIAKLDHARRQAEASVKARPTVQPAGAAIAQAINGKARG